jgi:hypothetical protein
MPDDFDPTTIPDPTLHAVVQTLMNQVETLHEQVRTQAAEIQRLRDEIARLKGEQGKPDIKLSRPPDEQHDRSSEAERKPPRTPRGKRARNQELTVTREEVVRVDPTTLPEDAQFKGYQPVIVQDVLLSSEVIRFQKETYYSSEQRQTYTAPLPPGYDGAFGPNTRALALTLYYDSGLSMPKIQALFVLAGVQILSRVDFFLMPLWNAIRHCLYVCQDFSATAPAPTAPLAIPAPDTLWSHGSPVRGENNSTLAWHLLQSAASGGVAVLARRHAPPHNPLPPSTASRPRWRATATPPAPGRSSSSVPSATRRVCCP